MKIAVQKDYDAMSLCAARLTAEEINKHPELVLGLATGSTPLGMYRNWIRMVKDSSLSFAGVTTFNLDEYLGLPPNHPQSYRQFMNEQLFRYIDINPARTFVPNGISPDPLRHCKEYDLRIEKAGGIDIQILGIGRNGHIGFNEPGEDFGQLTHVVKLSESTRQANSRFFPSLDDVPTHAITMGLKSIMKARKVILLASGEDKSEAVFRAVFGDVTESHPASILQLHPNCIFVLDEAAASKIPADARDWSLCMADTRP
ncbi:glucosamine-6-phosphate deaminase [Effusibacillus lacus]|uniref:Glucosamine-6-phosphate deaminase n=1 Tax=Effusibacillus lacus TaxID=1348429 RepID=A0A292YTH6_9BACL|nr:glucosamine-6-phosphate deaminase [Effusibacillus lacus]TCS75875.1 glucosamine-6-phosphate deaminase [Effusibacillus lacus]GAX91734.1 glucosamine-6-phosphate deaminase [Effusibacillus lacus]